MAVRQPNAQYNLAHPDSLPIRMASRARRRMYEKFLRTTDIRPEETLLDVGVTSDQSYDSSNYIEAWYPHKHKITAVGLDDAAFLERKYPGVTFRRADGRDLPFAAKSFDVVHSSAVLEHVGSASSQAKFVDETLRVARRAVFLTTPNRWFPIEVHTQLPLVHWLPKPVFRRLLAGTRYDLFAKEETLNLLGRKDVMSLGAHVDGWSMSIDSLRLLGVPSNLLIAFVAIPQQFAGRDP